MPLESSEPLELVDQKWLSLSTEFPQKPFIDDPNALALQDELLYDSYLTDPLVDPFFDSLYNPLAHHPLHDPIIESLHRHSRSKPSISTLVFRTLGEPPAAPAHTPPTSSSPGEFSFRHMVHMSEDFANFRASGGFM